LKPWIHTDIRRLNIGHKIFFHNELENGLLKTRTKNKKMMDCITKEQS